MDKVPPVGKRPMLDPETHNRLVEYGRFVSQDKVAPKEAPGGVVHYDAFARSKLTGSYMWHQRERRGRATLTVHCNRLPTQHGELWAVTASYPDFYPTWDEMKRLRMTFMPDDIDVMMMFPGSKGHYINDHPYALWLWECPSEWGWPKESPEEQVRQLGGTILNA